MNLSGVVRRVMRQQGTVDLGMNEFGNLRVDKYLPDFAQLAKEKAIWCFSTGAGTAIAPVTAMPTTTATWAVFNGEEQGGKTLSVLLASCYSVSGTLGLGMSLLGTVAQAPVTGTKPTAYASSVVSSLSGSRRLPAHLLAQNVTMVDTPAWAVLASRDQVSAISVGSGLTADVRGMLQIPPQHVGAFTVLAPTGTSALFGVSIVCAEIDIEQE